MDKKEERYWVPLKGLYHLLVYNELFRMMQALKFHSCLNRNSQESIDRILISIDNPMEVKIA